MKTIA